LEKREAGLNPGKETDGKKQISFADTEASTIGKSGNFEYKYNGHIFADKDKQIIVGQHLSQNANDKKRWHLLSRRYRKPQVDTPQC